MVVFHFNNNSATSLATINLVTGNDRNYILSYIEPLIKSNIVYLVTGQTEIIHKMFGR
jgi:hypothetical protein